MSRLRAAGRLAASVALCSLTAVASAGAAAWQGPAPISAATVNADGATIALGRAGDAVAAWLGRRGAGGRIAMARKRAGAAWSAPVTVGHPVQRHTVFPAVDGSGNITVAYPVGNVTTVATWSTASASPTLTPLPGDLTVTDLAVDAAGDAVIAGLSGSPAAPTVALPARPDGSFALHGYPYTDLGASTVLRARCDQRVGHGRGGLRDRPKLLAVTRTATTDWPATPETVEGTLTVSTSAPAVGIDGAGNVLAAFTYGTAPTTILRTARRPAGGGWLPSSDLSPATASSSADFLEPRGQPVGPGRARLDPEHGRGRERQGALRHGRDRRLGPDRGRQRERCDHTRGRDRRRRQRGRGLGALHDGRQPRGGQRARRGRAGAWGAIRPLSAVHANGVIPSLSGDGLGDFATLGTPYDGTYHPVVLSFYDAAPPVLAPITFTGAVLRRASRHDGDDDLRRVVDRGRAGVDVRGRRTATGRPSRTPTTSASYIAHVSVTDAAGNTARSEFFAIAVSAEAFVERAAVPAPPGSAAA